MIPTRIKPPIPTPCTRYGVTNREMDSRSRSGKLSGPDIISVPRHFVTQQAHWQNQSEGQDSMINRKIFRDPILLVLLGVLMASLLAYFFEILPYPFGLLVLSVFIAARIVHKSQFR